MSEETTFGALLRRYRERAGLTHEGLAERAEASPSAISALERGRRQHPYPHTVSRLAEALDLSPEERAAFRALALARGAHVTAPPRAVQRTAPASNLPATQTSLIGRERDIATLVALVPAHLGRLVTLTGIGGGGKTRLALAVADALRGAFADDVWLVELAPLADPALVPAAVAAVLAIPEVVGEPPVEQLAAALQRRHLLLVLDNCEHLIEACADLAERLLAACPDVHILATSREPLRLARERRWRVPGLAAPDLAEAVTRAAAADSPAVQLFVARAQASVPDFGLTDENYTTIAQICARLGGIPLALELAARRVPVLAPRQILERLDDAIRLLTGGGRAAPTRQQTLRATLQWSHALLTPPEQRLLGRLAVCLDGCEIEAAEAVGAGPDLPAKDVLDTVGRLVDRSLVQVSAAAGAARYGLLEPVRQFALGLLAKEERAATQARHAACYLALAERAAPALHGPDQVAWLGRLEHEFGNLRAALTWAAATGEVETGLRLAVAVAPFWETHGHLEEGRRWIKQLLSVRPQAGISAGLRARALLAGGRLAYWQKQLDEAAALLGVSLAAARRLDDRPLMAEALACLGAVQAQQGGFAQAAHLMEESLALAQAADDSAGIAFALLTLGVTVGFLGDGARSVALLEESLARYRRLGDVRWTAIALTKLGEALLQRGEAARAAELMREGLAGHLAVGDRAYMVFGLLHVADVLAALARPLQAANVLGAMTALREVLAAPPSTINQRMYSRIEASVRSQVPDTDYLAAWAEGRALPLHEVVTRTLEATPGVGAGVTSMPTDAPPVPRDGAQDERDAAPKPRSRGTARSRAGFRASV